LRFVSPPEIGISSSDLRRRVRAGEPIAYQVPTAVERYISDHGLYRTEP
jgi:nicotinate-nucleotide adenylyltransferase